MKISAVSCILGIINTLAAYSRGVPYIECMMESVFCILYLAASIMSFQSCILPLDVETKS